MARKFNNPNELIAILEKLGLLDEFDEKVEEQKLEVRKKLLRDRFILRSERDKVMPGLVKEAEEATKAFKLGEENQLKLRQAMNDANLRVYGATLSYCEDKLNFDIEKAAPQFMQDAFDQLGEIRDFLRGAVRSWRVSEPDGWNHRSIDMSNVEQIAALRTKCEAGQEKIREWMYDVDTPVEEQRKCCGKVVAICLEATHPQLKDYPGFLAYQEKKDKSKK